MDEITRHWVSAIITVGIIGIFGGIIIGGVLGTNSARREVDTIREQLDRATSINNELAGQLSQCREITEQLGDTTGRNVETIRDCIDIIEEIRTEVYNLQKCCDSFNWDSYYDYWDTYYDIK